MLDPVTKALWVSDKLHKTQPTEAQKHAGNYRKHHVRWHGLEIALENLKGTMRTGRGWKCKVPAHYGYVKGTEGADGDHVDVYVGDDTKSNKVYVIDQLDAKTGQFDEHKAMIGFPSEAAAKKCYVAGFSDGKGKGRMGAVNEMSVDEFKHWLKHEDTKSAIN